MTLFTHSIGDIFVSNGFLFLAHFTANTMDKSKTARLVSKVCGMLCGVLLLALGVLCFSALHCSGGTLRDIRNVHFILFGILVLLAEFELKVLLQWCSVFSSYIGKGVVYFFIATLLIFSTEWEDILVCKFSHYSHCRFFPWFPGVSKCSHWALLW